MGLHLPRVILHFCVSVLCWHGSVSFVVSFSTAPSLQNIFSINTSLVNLVLGISCFHFSSPTSLHCLLSLISPEINLYLPQTIMHEAIGFHHVQSGTNFTMEWYQMCDLFNASFPRVLANDSLLWCNQGAACIQNGIDKSHWEQNGTIIEVAEISGNAIYMCLVCMLLCNIGSSSIIFCRVVVVIQTLISTIPTF